MAGFSIVFLCRCGWVCCQREERSAACPGEMASWDEDRALETSRGSARPRYAKIVPPLIKVATLIGPLGEDIWETAVRETFEETRIRTEFVCVLSMRHMHKYNWGIDDLYFACLLRPLNTDIQANPNEIADAKWMNVREKLQWRL